VKQITYNFFVKVAMIKRVKKRQQKELSIDVKLRRTHDR